MASKRSCCLAVDVMGGDFGPPLIVPSVLDALDKLPRLHCQLHGDQEQIEQLLQRARSRHLPRIDIIHAGEQVSMAEKPATALRKKHRSSMWQALDAVARGDADGCVSAGNSGALMAMAGVLLGTLPGISRPAICTALPTRADKVYLLDMGANIGCDALQLHQFAAMATALVEVVERRPRPRVGLLNVGSEAGKGDAVVQDADRLLACDPQINYCGYAEGDGIFSGDYDVIVCDGFAGNVALKSIEGVGRLIVERMTAEFSGSPMARLGALIARSSLIKLQNVLDPANYNGASLLGLNGTVVKSHGSANRKAFANALAVAVGEIQQQIPGRISNKLGQLAAASAHLH